VAQSQTGAPGYSPPGIAVRSLTPHVRRCTLESRVSVQVHLPMHAKGAGVVTVTARVVSLAWRTPHPDQLAIHKLQTLKGANKYDGAGAERQ
jgi:hypothetical protein